MTAKEAARADAQAKLREWLKPGDTVYTILRSVSRSGMSRTIGVVLLQPDNRGGTRPLVDLHPNWLVSQAVGLRMSAKDRDGVVVGGCGMDMGFHLVYSLSASLFRDGFGCIGEGCPSNDHSNGDRDYTPHGSADPGHVHLVGCYKPGSRQGTRAYTPVREDGLDRNLRDMKDVDFTRESARGLTLICPEPVIADHWHKDGGYALRQRWL